MELPEQAAQDKLEKFSVAVLPSKVKSLKKCASEAVMRDLFSTVKRKERQEKINKIMPDLFESLLDALPEAININLLPRLWYWSRSRPATLKIGPHDKNVILSPCGNYICYREDSVFKELVVINRKGKKVLSEILIHPWQISSFAFSPCGKYLAVAQGNRVDIYDIETPFNTVKFIHKDNSGFIVNCCWSPCGKYILTMFCPNRNTVYYDKPLVLWDLESGDTKYFKHNGVPNLICFSREEKYLLTHVQGKILFWDMKTGNNIFQLPVYGQIKTFFLSSDNKYLVLLTNFSPALYGLNRSEILLYDTQDFKQPPSVFRSFDKQIHSGSVRENSDQLFIKFEGSPSELLLLNLNGNMSTIKHEKDAGFFPSRSGRLLIIAKNNKATIWDCASGKRCFSLKFKYPINNINFDFDGTILLSTDRSISLIPTPEAFLSKKGLIEPGGLEKFLNDYCRRKPQNTGKKLD